MQSLIVYLVITLDTDVLKVPEFGGFFCTPCPAAPPLLLQAPTRKDSLLQEVDEGGRVGFLAVVAANDGVLVAFLHPPHHTPPTNPLLTQLLQLTRMHKAAEQEVGLVYVALVAMTF